VLAPVSAAEYAWIVIRRVSEPPAAVLAQTGQTDA
jgi:hypothetical protein